MSLVFGLCLSKKIYLVSDSRLSNEDGSFRDDFAKWLNLNAHLSVVVAGSAHQACWLLRKIRQETKEDWLFADLEGYLQKNIHNLSDQYYAETGRISNRVGMIFGGFDKDKKLTVDAVRLGEIMSSPVRDAGEGVRVMQTVDLQIREALARKMLEYMAKGKNVGSGDIIEIDSPKPRLIAITIKATNKGSEVIFDNAECYDFLVFNPKYKTKKIVLPDLLFGKLDYRDKSQKTEESTLYQDQGYILTYVYRLLKERGWPTVGGQIIPLVMTPAFSGFAMAEHIYTPRGGGNSIRGGIISINGRMHYYDENHILKPFEFVYDFIKNMDAKGDAKI
ncbi:MAG: hypothetical protein WCG84_02405 [Candidatus Moraniibacteriota bacterium]